MAETAIAKHGKALLKRAGWRIVKAGRHTLLFFSGEGLIVVLEK